MKIYFCVLFSFVTLIAKCQYIKQQEVPSNIKLKVDSLYPLNKYSVWEIVEFKTYRDYKYEATFTENHQRIWVTINLGSQIINIEKAINKDSIPTLAKEYIKTYFIGNIIDTRVLFSKDHFYYYVALQEGNLTYSLYFNKDGSIYKEKNNLVALLLKSAYRSLLITY